MHYSKEDIKNAAEKMPLSDFQQYLSAALNHHRKMSKDTEENPFQRLNNNGQNARVFFDRVVYLEELAKNFEKSIYEYQQLIESNHEQWHDIKRKMIEADERNAQIRNSLAINCERINDSLLALPLTSILKPNAFQRLSVAIKNKNHNITSELQEVFTSINLKPQFASSILDDFAIKDGEYENFCKIKNELFQLMQNAINPENLNKIESLSDSQKVVIDNLKDLKLKVIEWRQVLIKTLNVEYSQDDLKINMLSLR